MQKSRPCMTIKEGSTCLQPSFISLQMQGSQDSIWCEIGRSRMGLQSMPTGPWLKELQPCLQSLAFPSLWGEVLASFVHVSNCLPTASISKQTTPYQLWHGRKPDVSPFCIWGCLAYVHVQKDKRRSLGSHMQKCVFIGYPSGYKGWKC